MLLHLKQFSAVILSYYLQRLVYELVNDAGMKVMEAENKKKKIGLKPIKETFPEDRIRGIIDKLVEISMDEERDG